MAGRQKGSGLPTEDLHGRDQTAALDEEVEFNSLHSQLGTKGRRNAIRKSFICSPIVPSSPNYSVPYLKRGLIYKQQGQIQEAVADFERAKKRAIDSKWRDEAAEQLRLLGEEEPP